MNLICASILLALTPVTASAATIDVIDGDTISYNGRHVRIANIDAPETGDRAKCDAEQRLGEVAKARLRTLLAEGDVEVHPGDPKDGRTEDRYGRLLATVSVDGRDVGEIMVGEKLVRPWNGRRRFWCR